MTIHVQRAHVRDLGKVKPLWKELIAAYEEIAGPAWALRDPADAWQRRMQEYLEWVNDATGVIFIATEDEEILGYAALHFTEAGAAFDQGEVIGQIESLIVTSEQRGRGVGSALLVACRRECEKREIRYWTIDTLAAGGAVELLCARHGFTPFSTRLAQRLDDDD